MEQKQLFALLIAIIALGLIIYFLVIPKPPKNEERAPLKTPPTTIPGVPLSEIQIVACNSADEAGTCETKLKKLNIVKAEDCCEYLGKCC